MKCPSGKRAYLSKELAEEALIGARINFRSGQGGPVNIYECRDCGNYHLTSRGPLHELLESKEVLDRIKLERESREWERKLR